MDTSAPAAAPDRRRGPNRTPDAIRALLVGATVELLSEGPPASVTVRAIADRAGVQHSLITRHFTSKDHLVAVALGELAAEYAAVVEGGADPVDGYLSALDHLRANPTGAFALAAGGSARAGESPEERFPGLAAHVGQIVAAGGRDDDHTRLVAGLTVALVAGWSVLEPNVLAAGGLDHLDPETVQREVAGVVRRLIEREIAPAATDERTTPMTDAPPTTEVADTELGAVEHLDRGVGDPVLFVHGSPGGADQGALMGAFLVAAGFRVVALSRPGYLGTPLDDDRATPDQQAALELALMDHLGIDRFAVVCWSGGGPSSYRLAAQHTDRVRALVSLAGVSGPYEFPSGAAGLEESLLSTRFGRWLMKELVRHRPHDVVKMVPAEEGDLTKEQAAALAEQIWNDPVKREFVLELSNTVAGRKVGLKNDAAQFPHLDLDLGSVTVPTLLVHGTVDTDVPPEHSERALAEIGGAEILRVADGTHVCAWTDPTTDEIHSRVVGFLRR